MQNSLQATQKQKALSEYPGVGVSLSLPWAFFQSWAREMLSDTHAPWGDQL